MLPTHEPLASELRALPKGPGVYRFQNAQGETIYVGKAKDLRRRVTSYWSSRLRDHRMVAHVPEIASITFEECASEAAALEREGELLAELQPRYNVADREGRRSAYLLLVNEEFPRLSLRFGRPNEGEGSAFGPFRSVGDARRLLETLPAVSPIRSCELEITASTPALERPCLLGDLGRCSAPCVGRISAADYALEASRAAAILGGEREALLAPLRARMETLASEERFEEAASIRDRIRAIERIERMRARGVDVDPEAEAARRARALLSLGAAAGLSEEQHLGRVVCFDVSTLQGSHTTGAMGVAIDGAIERRAERVWRLRPQATAPDDLAAHAELAGRYLRAVGEGREPSPDLILVDGGIDQLEVWLAAGVEAAFFDEAFAMPALLGIAKTPDRLIRIDGETLTLPTDDPGLLLAGRIRDRAHERAGRLGAMARGQAMIRSQLDEVPGLGAIMRVRLLRRFGSADGVRRAADADLLAVEGLGSALLAALRRTLN